MNVNDILVSTWGYDQTNVDFYVVVGKTAKNVRIQKVKTVREHREDPMHYHAVPDVNAIEGKPMLRKITLCMGNEYVAPDEYARATQWDGRPYLGTCYA